MAEVISTQKEESAINGFFGVIAEARTYKRLVYLLMTFPLGIIYFVLLTTGLSVGLGLLITFIGVFVLFGVILASIGISNFERAMIKSLLDIEIPYRRQPSEDNTIFKRMGALLKESATWKGLVYQFALFPMGIVAFVLVVTFLSTSLALIAAPVICGTLGSSVFTIEGTTWLIDQQTDLILSAVVGVFLLFSSLHMFNGLAWAYGKFAQTMLSNNPTPVERAREEAPFPAVERSAQLEVSLVPQK